MQQLLFENAWVVGLFGLGCTLIVAFMWIQTANRYAFYGAIGMMVLTLLAVWLNLSVETDREHLKGVLKSMAVSVQENDFEAVFERIDKNAPGYQRAKQEIPRFEFTYARVTRIKDIQVNYDTIPPTALVEFNGVAAASRGDMKGRIPRFVRAYFMQVEDKWLLKDYEHFEPIEGFR